MFSLIPVPWSQAFQHFNAAVQQDRGCVSMSLVFFIRCHINTSPISVIPSILVEMCTVLVLSSTLQCHTSPLVLTDEFMMQPRKTHEIKSSMADNLSELNYLKFYEQNGKYSLKKSHAYHYQVMGCMGLTGSKWRTFMSPVSRNFTVKEFILMQTFSLTCLANLIDFISLSTCTHL